MLTIVCYAVITIWVSVQSNPMNLETREHIQLLIACDT